MNFSESPPLKQSAAPLSIRRRRALLFCPFIHAKCLSCPFAKSEYFCIDAHSVREQAGHASNAGANTPPQRAYVDIPTPTCCKPIGGALNLPSSGIEHALYGI
nr:MAG TPA: hypothetical protein [Bacteriophage sp.]